MSGRRCNVEGLRRLRSGGVLWPVSLVARVGGVTRQRVYDLHDRGHARLVCVEGYLFADLDAILRWLTRCQHTRAGERGSVGASVPVCSARVPGGPGLVA